MRKSRRTIFRRLFKPAWLYFFSRALKPLSHNYGSNRGTPIDRYYIEKFLSDNAHHIKGKCLEIKDNNYTKNLGRDSVFQSDVLDMEKSNINATIYGDLRNMNNIADNAYDCIILTQVLQFIDDVPAVIKECFRILKPNGCLLITAPSISRIDVRTGIKGDFWRFTVSSMEYLLKKSFIMESIEIKSWGNVLAGTAFWIGMAREELSQKELDHNDSDFPVIISARAIK